MSRKSIRKKVAEEFRRKQRDRIERDRIKYSKDFHPEHPDNK